MKKVLLAGFLALLTSVTLAVAPAEAAPAASIPGREYAVNYWTVSVKVDPTTLTVDGYTGKTCWYRIIEGSGHNLFKLVIYKMTWRQWVCYPTPTLTPQVNYIGVDHYSDWAQGGPSFVKMDLSDRRMDTLNMKWEGRVLRRVHLKVVVYGVEVQNTDACLQLRMNAKPSVGYSYWINCNILAVGSGG